MALKRILALLFSVAVIAGAFLARDAIDNGGSISIGSGDTPIVCDSTIADQCKAVFGDGDLTIEAPGATFDRLRAERDVAPMVWIVGGQWPAMLAVERERLSLPALDSEAPTPIASTGLGLVGRVDDCESLSWGCVAAAGRNVDIGIDSLEHTAGLAAYGQIVAAHLGRQDFASNDFAEQAFRTWRNDFRSHTDFVTGNSSALDLFVTRAGTYDVASALEADAIDLGRTDQIVLPEGPSVEIVALGLGDARPPELDGLSDELVTTGWTEGGAADNGGPSAGVLIALLAES